MKKYVNIRQRIVQDCMRRGGQIVDTLSRSKAARNGFDQFLKTKMAQQGHVLSDQELEHGYIKSLLGYRQAVDICRASKVVMFSTEQAKVFESIQKDYADTLDYKLPFPCTMLQFDTPFEVPDYLCLHTPHGDSRHILALLLRQDSETVENYNKGVEEYRNALQHSGINTQFMDFQRLLPTETGNIIQNLCVAIYDTYHPAPFSWQTETALEKSYNNLSDENLQRLNFIRNLAVACVGYINCENVYLHREGEVPNKANRKRARKGKIILDPYYVCRIRGVQYDSNGEPTGEGTHHGFRYDVRGHFRRLESGKTTWVRPHQRGLQHELYVPKTYVVDKKPSIRYEPAQAEVTP